MFATSFAIRAISAPNRRAQHGQRMSSNRFDDARRQVTMACVSACVRRHWHGYRRNLYDSPRFRGALKVAKRRIVHIMQTGPSRPCREFRPRHRPMQNWVRAVLPCMAPLGQLRCLRVSQSSSRGTMSDPAQVVSFPSAPRFND